LAAAAALFGSDTFCRDIVACLRLVSRLGFFPGISRRRPLESGRFAAPRNLEKS
jgi:hypothetical protein